MDEKTLLTAIKIATLISGCEPELCKNDNEDDRYVIARTYSAGVFAGNIVRRDGMDVELRDARRLWKWAGASSLSQLAMEGTKKPDDCMFPCEVNRVVLTQTIEILDVTDAAKKSIKGVPIWEQ